jgi:hypothetical protein
LHAVTEGLTLKKCHKAAVDWLVDFAELFAPGGFDLVLANLPHKSFGLRGVGKLAPQEKSSHKAE